jgi:hypothetical protein
MGDPVTKSNRRPLDPKRDWDLLVLIDAGCQPGSELQLRAVMAWAHRNDPEVSEPIS